MSSVCRLLLRSWLLLVALALCASTIAQAQPAPATNVKVNAGAEVKGVIFAEDFEVSMLEGLRAKGWPWLGPLDGGCVNYCAISLVSSTSHGAAPHGGSKMILLEYRGLHQTGPCCDLWDIDVTSIWRPLPAAPEIYMRYWFRTEVNTKNVDGTEISPNPPTQSGYSQITGKQHYIKVDGTSPDGYPNVVPNHYWESRELMLDFQGSQDEWQLSPNMASIPLLDNQWYCIEYHIKMNTPDVADGVDEIWIDGVQTHGRYNRLFRNAAHGSAAFTGIDIFRQGSDYMNRYEDDMVMATTRIGCG